jgi:hypothetical protein
MKNRIDDFIENLTEDEVSQLMYRISKRVLIPQYFTKEDIKNMFEEDFEDCDLLKIFNNLIVLFDGGRPQVLEETLHNIIYDYVYKENT